MYPEGDAWGRIGPPSATFATEAGDGESDDEEEAEDSIESIKAQLAAAEAKVLELQQAAAQAKVTEAFSSNRAISCTSEATSEAGSESGSESDLEEVESCWGFPDASQVNSSQMEEYLHKLFQIGDTNGDGVLQPAELAKLLKLSGSQLDAEQVIAMVLAADLNGAGVIEYEEFVPIAIELMHTAQTLEDTPQHSLERDWTSVSESEMNGYLRQLFSIADTNGDGVLQPVEYLKLMQLSGLQFPADLVLQGFVEADLNGDGVIDLDEFTTAFQQMIADAKDAAPAAIPSVD